MVEQGLEFSLQKCHHKCVLYSRIIKMYESSELPDKFWNFEQYVPEDVDRDAWKTLADIRRKIVDFIDAEQNIYLYSQQTGNGKTLWAGRLLKTLIYLKAQNVFNTDYVRYVYIPDFIYHYEVWDKYSYEDTRKVAFFDSVSSLSNSAFVVWDGFGNNPSISTRVETVVINSVISDRINKGFSNLFISDKTPQSLRSQENSKAFFTRILNSCIEIEFKGGDYRKKNLWVHGED